jgi:hypothetical protein
MPSSNTGRCLCGDVRYELKDALTSLVNCHCQYCRRAHGAAFATVCWLPASAFQFTSGEDVVEKYGHAAGFRCFCRHCGTRIFNGSTDGGGFISLVVSTLDSEPVEKPIMHINLESKAPWHEVTDNLPQHQTLPAEVSEAINRMKRS